MKLTTCFALIMALCGAQGPGNAEGARSVLPFVGDQVVVVAAANLTKVDPQAIVKRLAGEAAEEEGIRGPAMLATSWVDRLKAAGARQLFVLVDLTEMPCYPTAVVPLVPGADAEEIKGIFAGGKGGPIQWPRVETIRGAVVAGTAGAVERLLTGAPAARNEVVSALDAAGDAPITVAIVPSKVQRRALEESITTLPAEVGGGDVRVVTQGLAWAMFSAAFEPESAFHAIFEAKNAESSGELLKLIDGGMRVLKKIGDETPIIRPLINTVLQAKPVATGNRITIDADLQKMTQLLAIPIQELREAARRTQCVNNLKQIGLAMHNFHDKHKTFPSAYTKGADGKPLLSWRVQILPFLDQNSLYKEFHQDEPWDSEHNRALISRMPTVFACPSGGSAVVKAGKTTYLAPRGRDTIFSGGDAVKIQAITDGTSNTIFVVDASDEAAVIWTKPDDWHVPDPVSVKGLVGHHPEGFNVSFADGSVRFLKGSILGKVLAALLTGSGGEVISSDAS